MKDLKMYINGKFVESKSGKWINVLNPSTEEVISRQPEGTVEEVDEALDAAKAAQKAWAKTPAIERAAYLKKMADGIRKRQDEFVDIIMREQGARTSCSSKNPSVWWLVSCHGTSPSSSSHGRRALLSSPDVPSSSNPHNSHRKTAASSLRWWMRQDCRLESSTSSQEKARWWATHWLQARKSASSVSPEAWGLERAS